MYAQSHFKVNRLHLTLHHYLCTKFKSEDEMYWIRHVRYIRRFWIQANYIVEVIIVLVVLVLVLTVLAQSI